MSKMRTITEAYAHLKESDPDTAITPYGLRRLVVSGKIPCIKSGNKYLLNLDLLEEYLSGNLTLISEKETRPAHGIRPLPERRLK